MATMLQPVTVHQRICIGGVVQGVGFRPFAYRLAQRFNLRAFILNTSSCPAEPAIAARFHNTAARLIEEVCQRIRRSECLDRVCLSGGTFQNVYLLQHTVARLKGAGFQVFLHSLVPPNHGGVSLRQAVIATEIFT